MIELEFNPTKAHLARIKEWLKEEGESTGEGFFCNWGVIQRCFDDQRLIIGLYQNIPIGFVTHNQIGSTLVFDIMEIKPTHRNKGLGKQLFLESIKYFKEKGVSKIEVDSINEGSARFCRKLGFTVDNDPIERSSNNLKLLV